MCSKVSLRPYFTIAVRFSVVSLVYKLVLSHIFSRNEENIKMAKSFNPFMDVISVVTAKNRRFRTPVGMTYIIVTEINMPYLQDS